MKNILQKYLTNGVELCKIFSKKGDCKMEGLIIRTSSKCYAFYKKIENYLEIDDVLVLTVTEGDIDVISNSNPDFIMIDDDLGTTVLSGFMQKLSWKNYRIGKLEIVFDNFTVRLTICYNSKAESVFTENMFQGKMTIDEFTSKLSSNLRVNKGKKMELRLVEFFTKVGLYSNLTGYSYLLTAVEKSVDSPSLLQRITKGLYPTVALEHGTSAELVERNIRNAIEVIYNRGKLYKVANSFYGGNFEKNEKPSNGEFIAFLTTIV